MGLAHVALDGFRPLAAVLANNYFLRDPAGLCDHRFFVLFDDVELTRLSNEPADFVARDRENAVGRGIGHVLAHGIPGETYNGGGPDECENNLLRAHRNLGASMMKISRIIIARYAPRFVLDPCRHGMRLLRRAKHK